MFKPALQFPRAAESPGPATVLFIDDDEGILRTGTGVLQRAGYHVHPADSAEEAWQLWERHKYQFRAIIADNRRKAKSPA